MDLLLKILWLFIPRVTSINTMALTAPSANVSGAPNDTFTMTITTTNTGHGGDEAASIYWEMRIDSGSWVTIPSTGGELEVVSSPTNPDDWLSLSTVWTRTVTLKTAGQGKTIEIRGHTSGINSGELYDPGSGYLTVTVTGGTTSAAGTITATGTLAGKSVSRAFGTITASADLTATGISKVEALGTSTITGDLTATNHSLGFGTTTFIGQLIAGGGTQFVSATTTFSADLTATGTTNATATTTSTGTLAAIGTIPAAATGSSSGVAFASAQHRYYEVTPAPIFAPPVIVDPVGATTATGTITATGDLVSRGTSNAKATITALGQGLSEGTHLAQATSTFSGDLASIGRLLGTGATGTITCTSQIAASGTQLASGTIGFTGELAAIGSGGEQFGPASGVSFASAQHNYFYRNDQKTLHVGLRQTYRITPTATINVFGLIGSDSGLKQVTGTITVTGDLRAREGTVEDVISSTSVLADEQPIQPSFVFLGRGVPSANITSGTINVSGTLSAGTDLTQFAFGTITVIGDVTVGAEGVVSAAGTITAIGDLAATNGTFVLTTISGTITVFGSVVADSSLVQASATITATGALTSLGTVVDNTEYASATITISGSLSTLSLAFCPITASGTINVLGDIGGDIEQTVFGAFGSINVAGSLTAPAPTFFKDNGISLARGTITFTGDLAQAEFRKVTCITPTATITVPGFTLAAFGGDLNQKYSFASINIEGTLGVSSIYARSESLAVIGSLTARGRQLPLFNADLLAQPAVTSLSGRIGPGTIDGRKTAIINIPYKSLELYNNGAGGFYTIGDSQELREVFGLINFRMDLNAIGSRDTVKFAIGTITAIGELAAVGEQTSVTASISIAGSIAAKAGFTLGKGTSTVIGDLAAVASATGGSFSPTYNGAQAPTLVGDSFSNNVDIANGPASTNANGWTQITVENSASDSVINIIGFEDGGQPASYAQADTDIFNLNERPDSVAIRLVSEAITDTDPAHYPSQTFNVGTFTDATDFDPTNAVQYGYRADSYVEATDPPGNPPTVLESGEIETTVEFTFKKAGYLDLVVTYKVRGSAQARATNRKG